MIGIQLQPALFLVQAYQSLPSCAIIVFEARRSEISFLCRFVLIQFVTRKSEENIAGREQRRQLAWVSSVKQSPHHSRMVIVGIVL